KNEASSCKEENLDWREEKVIRHTIEKEEKEVTGADNENAAQMYQSAVDFPSQDYPEPKKGYPKIPDPPPVPSPRITPRLNLMKRKKTVKEAIRAKSENATNKYQSAVDTGGYNDCCYSESLNPFPISAMIASPIPWPLEELRQRTNFSAKAVTDQRAPWIWDIQLLPGDRLLVADSETKSIKLFNSQ
ncbi:hypothetical protein PoB_001309800, partial [Plakobranchus ocellatus]